MKRGEEGWVWPEIDGVQVAAAGDGDPSLVEQIHGREDVEGNKDKAELFQGEKDSEMKDTTCEQIVEEEVRLSVEEVMLTMKERVIRSVDDIILHPTTCEGCIYPPVCNKCHVIGDVSVFRCYGYSLPVPKVGLPTCNVCGRDVVTSKYWCKDCSRTYGVKKDGQCFVCHRRPADFVDNDTTFVPDSAMD